MSWAILYALFDRVRAFNLGVVFLAVDLPVFVWLIYLTSGEQSWLFCLLFMRVADQKNTTFRRALLFSHLAVIEREPFDLALMDLQMPEMDGYAATIALRQDARFDSLPIIAMTAHAMAEERERCIDSGMNDHLSKPIDPDLLFATLARWDRRKERRQAQAPSPALAASAQVFASGTQVLEQVAQQNQLETMSELLDSADALRRVGGNMGLYRKLLAQFAASHADAPQRIRALLEAGDAQGAAAIAHSTRGVAANLGATVMAGLGAGLEEALNKGEDPTALLDGFERACKATMEAVRAMVPEAPAAEAPADAMAAVADTASPQLMQKLAALLAAGDADAVDFFAAHRKTLRLALRDQVDAIERAIGDFDFEAALDLLRATANEI